MNVNQLHKLTAKLIDQGHARKQVCINKRTFGHVLEQEGCTILDVESAEIQTTEIMDGDGATATRKDGTVCQRIQLVLTGDWEEPRETKW